MLDAHTAKTVKSLGEMSSDMSRKAFRRLPYAVMFGLLGWFVKFRPDLAVDLIEQGSGFFGVLLVVWACVELIQAFVFYWFAYELRSDVNQIVDAFASEHGKQKEEKDV